MINCLISLKRAGYMEYIDITHLLELDDYYKTDPHWRQEKITDVAEYLADSMNTHIGNKYEKIEIQDEFYGTYCGQAAKPLPSEKMYCLENEVINQCKVYDYQNNEEIGMYDSEKAKGRDPYEAVSFRDLFHILLLKIHRLIIKRTHNIQRFFYKFNSAFIGRRI